MIRFAVCVLALFIAGCTSRSLFDQNTHLSSGIWRPADTAVFEVPIKDTLIPCNFYINLRVSKTYAYSNLWVFLYTTNPRGDIEKDTLEFVLADPEGRWQGKGVSDILEYDIMFRYKAVFPESGTYRFAFEQGMRSEALEGITDIGLRIERSAN
jgi:gliding motility-associated lipoprotein GldH